MSSIVGALQAIRHALHWAYSHGYDNREAMESLDHVCDKLIGDGYHIKLVALSPAYDPCYCEGYAFINNDDNSFVDFDGQWIFSSKRDFESRTIDYSKKVLRIHCIRLWP
jgi:hypothetical protein